MKPKQGYSLMGDCGRKASPAGILKPPKYYSRENSAESKESRLDKFR